MGVAEVTEPVEIDAVGDRLFFTVISGQDRKTYSISFHKARNAAMALSSSVNLSAWACRSCFNRSVSVGLRISTHPPKLGVVASFAFSSYIFSPYPFILFASWISLRLRRLW